MIDIHHIIHSHLAELLNGSYDRARPELGVLVADYFTHGTQFQWRLVVEDGKLQLEMHRRNLNSSSIILVASADLADPDSLDPEAILGLKRLAVNQAGLVAATGLRRRSEPAEADI